MLCALFGECSSLGPNIIRAGHQKRFTASCAICFCSGVPFAKAIMASKPWRWWKLSSLQMRTIARAYGPYEVRQSATWFTMAAPSTSQPIAATSAQVKVG